MKFSEWLQAELVRLEWSQNELARRSEVPQPTIQRILAGADPKETTITKLKSALAPFASRAEEPAAPYAVTSDKRLAEIIQCYESMPGAYQYLLFRKAQDLKEMTGRLSESSRLLLSEPPPKESYYQFAKAAEADIQRLHNIVEEDGYIGPEQRAEDLGPPDGLKNRRAGTVHQNESFTGTVAPPRTSVGRKKAEGE